MFSVGEYIIYGTIGICRVENVGPSPYDKTDPRTFYLLIPHYNPTGSTIYTPVDNPHVPMRRLMTLDEIDTLIHDMPTLPLLTVAVEKHRREFYRSVIEELRPEGYVQVIKTIRNRRETLAASRKHLPITDLECERLAKHMLYSECAYVLGLEENDMESYITHRLPVAE